VPALISARSTFAANDLSLSRFTTLDDVVASALFLLSDDAAHVTGETLTIDGGQSLAQGMFRHSPIPQRP